MTRPRCIATPSGDAVTSLIDDELLDALRRLRRDRARRTVPRCIATPTWDTRCPNAASDRYHFFVCAEHFACAEGLDKVNTPSTRRMLAFAAWETWYEGQRLIDELVNRRPA